MHQPLNLPLARSALDRDYLQRTNPDLFDELWTNPLTRILVLHEGKTLLAGSGSEPEPVLRLFDVESVPSAQLRVYLGKTIEIEGDVAPDSPIVLAVLGKNSAMQIEPDDSVWYGLRHTGAGLSPRDAGLYAQALALANFHENHKHCSRCGMPTVIEEGGWSRRCFSDNSQVFPRTDPAIIVTVVDEQDRLLMGSQGSWEHNQWSILAGFVEPGESLAAAVIREVYEESGVHISHPEYIASQAWPFPYSLMVGFTAKVDSAAGEPELCPDGVEIEKLRWFSREDIANEIADLKLPGELSISRALIERWYGGPMPVAEQKPAAGNKAKSEVSDN